MACFRLSFVSSDPQVDARWRSEGTASVESISAESLTGAATWTQAGRALASSTDPLAAFDWLASDGRRWAGFVGYELNRFIERLPPATQTTTRLLSFWPVERGRSDEVDAGVEVTPPHAVGVAHATSRADYVAAARRAIDFIAAGDVFQVNLSQSLLACTSLAAPDIWRRLQASTPSAYGALIRLSDRLAILSNSPELFFRIEPLANGRRRITTRPIKGTRPRGPGMREALERSEKDKAELAMIVDLERNDLGRVCEIGSVRVVEPRVIEEHPTVYHGVATVEGLLRPHVTLADVFRAMFPCGSITGCPKVRAMEIIDALEGRPRGAYCGAIGYVDPDGSAEFSVAIRTMTMLDDIVSVDVGGGIVADSDPDDEHRETITKARAMLRALGVSDDTIDTLDRA